jgi:hypothetical protein
MPRIGEPTGGSYTHQSASDIGHLISLLINQGGFGVHNYDPAAALGMPPGVSDALGGAASQDVINRMLQEHPLLILMLHYYSKVRT